MGARSSERWEAMKAPIYVSERKQTEEEWGQGRRGAACEWGAQRERKVKQPTSVFSFEPWKSGRKGYM